MAVVPLWWQIKSDGVLQGERHFSSEAFQLLVYCSVLEHAAVCHTLQRTFGNVGWGINDPEIIHNFFGFPTQITHEFIVHLMK